MSTTITLEEALKKATKGPLYAKYDGDEVQIGNDQKFVAMTMPFDASAATEEDYVNAALLAHCYNVLPELVAALTEMMRGYSKDADGRWHRLHGPTETALNQAKSILTKATQVTLP